MLYDIEHRARRAWFAREMALGITFICPRCLKPITGQWDLGH
jgi:hypothetical protein